jgi:hypothetical protein
VTRWWSRGFAGGSLQVRDPDRERGHREEDAVHQPRIAVGGRHRGFSPLRRQGYAAAMMRRKLAGMFVIMIAAAACGDDGGGEVSVSGDAFLFNGGVDGRVVGATVTLVEDPARQVTTDGTGHFQLDGFAAGDEVTLALAFPDHHAIQTGTLTVAEAGLERVTFQVVHDAIYDLLADMLAITPDAGRCQVVTTVTRVGKSLYDEGAHGEAGATVTIDPPTGEEGPIYFDSSVLPDRALTETSDDGGVLFLQVPPGRYTLTATKPGVTFRPVTITCRAGFLVNASPPWGLQVL